MLTNPKENRKRKMQFGYLTTFPNKQPLSERPRETRLVLISTGFGSESFIVSSEICYDLKGTQNLPDTQTNAGQNETKKAQGSVVMEKAMWMFNTYILL